MLFQLSGFFSNDSTLVDNHRTLLLTVSTSTPAAENLPDYLYQWKISLVEALQCVMVINVLLLQLQLMTVRYYTAESW